MIAAAVGFGNEGPEFALAIGEMAMFEGMQRIADLLFEGRRRNTMRQGPGVAVGLVEGVGEQVTADFVRRGFEWIPGTRGVDQAVKESSSGKAFVPAWIER